MKRSIVRVGADQRGAVAPLIAVALFALIAVAGIAFDYARVAGMDTELQSAADQAALAAASQLDGFNAPEPSGSQKGSTKETFDESTLTPEERRNQEEKIQRYREQHPDL